MKLMPYTWITRVYSYIKNNTYTILNNFSNIEIVIDDYTYFKIRCILISTN